MAAGENHFATELNEKEVNELLENTTPGSIKKATKNGMKIIQGKNLKTLFRQFKHPSFVVKAKQCKLRQFTNLSRGYTSDFSLAPVMRFFQILSRRQRARVATLGDKFTE